MKKILFYGLGSLVAVVAPIATLISCSCSGKETDLNDTFDKTNGEYREASAESRGYDFLINITGTKRAEEDMKLSLGHSDRKKLFEIFSSVYPVQFNNLISHLNNLPWTNNIGATALPTKVGFVWYANGKKQVVILKCALWEKTSYWNPGSFWFAIDFTEDSNKILEAHNRPLAIKKSNNIKDFFDKKW